MRKILAACPPVAAAKALGLRYFWGFPNNYTLGKRLTELMVGRGCGLRSKFSVVVL